MDSFRMSMEAVDMDMLSIEVLSASQRISESTKMIKLDLQALQRSNKTKYIQVRTIPFHERRLKPSI